MNAIKQLGVGAISQLRQLGKTLFLLYLPIVLLFLIVILVSRSHEDMGVALFLRDLVSIKEDLPFYAGAVSQLGGLLWAAALTVCLLTRTLLGLRPRPGDSSRSRRFLLLASLLTAILMLDDVYLLHERAAIELFGFGDNVIYPIYALLGILLVVVSWREILSSEYLILMLALFLFGFSIFVDRLQGELYWRFDVPYVWDQIRMVLEDGSKFTGVATWLLYFVRYAIQKLGAAQPQIGVHLAEAMQSKSSGVAETSI